MLRGSPKSAIPLLLFLLLSAGAHAQTGELSGIVVDLPTGEAIPGVHVLVTGTLDGAVTDNEGRFLIANLAPGRVEVSFSSIGFAGQSRIVEVGAAVTSVLEISLEPVFLPLPNVEIVSNRSVAGRTTPSSFTRIRSEDLDLAQPLGTEEALRSVPGVYVATDDGISNRTNIGIRGLYPRRSDKILLLEDGVPIQPALYLAPSAYYNPPTERLDAIEVIKNATNVQFGAGSLVGAINYVTRRPPVNPGGVVSVTGGSHGYFSTLAAYGGSALRGRLGAELQLLYKRSDGFRANTGFDLYNLTAKALFRPTSRTTVSFKGNLHKEDAQATYSALTPYMFNRDPAQNPFEHDWLETVRAAADLNLEQTIGRNVVLLATAYTNRFTRDWWRQTSSVVEAQEIDDAAPAGAMVRIGLDENRSRLREFAVFGISPRLVVQIDAGSTSHTLEAGTRWHRDEFDNIEIDTDRPDARADDFDAASFGDPSHPAGSKRRKERFTADAIAVYAQDKLTIGSLGLSAGLRLESYRQRRTDLYDRSAKELINRHSEVTQTELVPALGLTYSTTSVTVFGGVFGGFVPLTSSFAFTSLIDDEGFEIDEHLRPEHSLNYELGVRFDEQAAVHGSVALFSNRVSNLVAAGRQANFQPVVANLGEVTYSGLELNAVFDVHDLAELPFRLSLVGLATLLSSEIKEGLIDERGNMAGADVTGNDAPYAPALVGRLGLSASAGGLDLVLRFNYVGEQFADFNNTVEETAAGDNGLLPSYSFFDGSARYKLPSLPLSLSLAVKNIADSIYKGSRLHRSSSGIFPGGFRQVNFGIHIDL